MAIMNRTRRTAPPIARCKVERRSYRPSDEGTCCCATGKHQEHVTYPDGPDGPRVVTCYHCKATIAGEPKAAAARPYYNTFHRFWGEWNPDTAVYVFARLEGSPEWVGEDGQRHLAQLSYGTMSNPYPSVEKARAEIAVVLGWPKPADAQERLRAALAIVKAPCVFSRYEDHIVIERAS